MRASSLPDPAVHLAAAVWTVEGARPKKLPGFRCQRGLTLLFIYLNPVEVKSGAQGTLRSLHQFIEMADHPYAVRIYGGALKVEKAITPNKKPYLLLNLPYYMGTCIPDYVEWLVQQKV
ncbi:hypothetical protein [Niabella aquatica]